MAETPDNEFDPSTLVPFTDPDDPGIPKLTREEATRELGIQYKTTADIPDENLQGMFNGFQQLRRMIDAIPTPGQDAGDAISAFSPFGIVKDVLTGYLDLMEMPTTGNIRPESVFEAVTQAGPGQVGLAVTKTPLNALGMFGSRPSKLAPQWLHEKFNTFEAVANNMEKEGADAESIFKETGLSKDHRQQWRYQIAEDLNNAAETRVNTEALDKLQTFLKNNQFVTHSVKLADLLHAPRAYNHWPELKDVKVFATTLPTMGSYNPIMNQITLGLDGIWFQTERTQDSLYPLRIIVHEAQHALQNMQGRPGGANHNTTAEILHSISNFNKIMAKRKADGVISNTDLFAIAQVERVHGALQEMQRFYGETWAAYWANPGEIEARMAELIAREPEMFGDRFPEGYWWSNRTQIPHPSMRFEPDDIKIPAREMPAAAKVFGTRGVSNESMKIPEKPEWATNWNDTHELRKHGRTSYRVTLNEKSFGQIRKDGNKWLAEIRDTETGDVIRGKGAWPSLKDAEAELRSIDPIDLPSR